MKPLDDGLKQRLIGAIILLALGVIFLPVLFDRDPIQPVDRTSQIPPAPEIVTVEIQDPVAPEIAEPLQPAPPPDEMYVPDETQPVSLELEKPGLDDSGIPKSWVLQVASFSDKHHAERLHKELVDNGFPAYTRTISVNGKPVTRVLVGPKLDKSALIQDKNKIDQAYKVDAIMLEFKP